MRVEIIKGRVNFRGEVRTSGVLEVPEVTGKHWIATGIAKAAEQQPNPPAPPPAPAAESGKKRF